LNGEQLNIVLQSLFCECSNLYTVTKAHYISRNLVSWAERSWGCKS